MKEAKLSLQNVSYVYSAGTPFEIQALDHVNVEIGAGIITGIIGHTGSGKSTLVQLFNGLLKPDEGKILLDGKDIWEKPKDIYKIRFRVGLVMQYPEYQLFEETVEKDIAYAPINMGCSTEEVTKRVTEAAAFTGLSSEILAKSPFDLSGGQKRRAAIAGIMAMLPEVLVLDEPAAGLDPRGKKEILTGIRNYQEKTGATVILVSHSMEDMAKYCDDLIVMSDAKVVMQGNCDQIFSKAAYLSQIGLDVPGITRMMQIIKQSGMDINDNVYTLEAAKQELCALFEKIRK